MKICSTSLSPGQANMIPHYLHYILGVQIVFCLLILDKLRLWWQTWIKQFVLPNFMKICSTSLSPGQANTIPHYLHYILGMQNVFCLLILENLRLWWQTWIKQFILPNFMKICSTSLSPGQANTIPHYLHYILGMQSVFCLLILDKLRLWWQTWIKQFILPNFMEICSTSLSPGQANMISHYLHYILGM